MRRQYSKKDSKEFLQAYPYAEAFMGKKSEVVEEEDRITVGGEVSFRRYGDGWIPSLELLRKHRVLPLVVVDKGAPPFILKGADLMRPGVVSCEAFEKDALVVIVDENHHYPLATGKALFSSEELMARENGKVVKIMHNLKSA